MGKSFGYLIHTKGSKSDMGMIQNQSNQFWTSCHNSEYIMADKGFRSLDFYWKNVCIPITGTTPTVTEFNNYLSHYRIIIENVFAQIKKWKIASLPLKLRYSNLNKALLKHDKIWRVVGWLTNQFHLFGIRK